MPDYRYELRRGEEVIATGHLSREESLEVGERITIGSQSGIAARSSRCCTSANSGSWCSSGAMTRVPASETVR